MNFDVLYSGYLMEDVGDYGDEAFEDAVDRPMRLKGEYWWVGGQLIDADGDVGDLNHEAIAIDAASRNFLESVGIDPDDIGYDMGYLDDYFDELAKLLKTENILDALNGLASEADDPKEAAEALGYALGKGDARVYGVRNLGWLRIKGNNIDGFDMGVDEFKTAADAVSEAYYQENDVEPPGNMELYVYDMKTNRSYDTTHSSLAAGNVARGELKAT